MKNKIDKLKAEMIKNSKESYNLLLCDFVKKITCSYFELENEISINTSRKKETVRYRQIAMYLIKKHSTMSYTDIGKAFGKDHATAIYSINTVSNYLDWDKDLKREIDDLERIIVLKTDAMLNNYNIDKNYYFIELNDFLSVKLNENKSIITTGFTKEEVKTLLNDKGLSGEIVEHKNKGLYILEQNQSHEKDENQD